MDYTLNTSFPTRVNKLKADLKNCQQGLPVRHDDAHKGSSGQVLITGGDQSMAGAACLAGWSAYIAGAGLVRVASHVSNTSTITACRPELIVSGIENPSKLKSLFHQSDVLALGPGLGQSTWSRMVFEYSLEHRLPNVIDADGLNLLAQSPFQHSDWVLTPHAGEAGRLLQCPITDIQADRPAAAIEIVKRYGGVCVLKGKGTLIASRQDDQINLWYCPYGNAALAVAGTGDVLTGVIDGLIAQGMEADQAAVSGVVLHASAGDIIADKQGQIGMLASDLMQPIRALRNAR